MKQADIWSNIALALQAYDTLEDARDLVRAMGDPDLAGKLNSARRSTVAQYLQLLRQAILEEPEFTEQTVEEWKRLGRLENEWRVSQAMKFVQSDRPETK